MGSSEKVEDKISDIIKQINDLDIKDSIKKKVIEILKSSIKEEWELIDITLETQINKLHFHDDKITNASILITLNQSGIYIIEDLINFNLDSFIFNAGNSILALESIKKVLKYLSDLWINK